MIRTMVAWAIMAGTALQTPTVVPSLSQADRDAIARVRRDPAAGRVPPDDSFTVGSRTIAVGGHVVGPVAVVNGSLDVLGTIDGDAVAITGDVVMHQGGHVRGNAFAAGGQVRLEGGTVDGEIRALSGEIGPPPAHVASRTIVHSPWRSFKLAIAWSALLLIVGIGVLTFADDALGHVTRTLGDHFWRSLWYGLLSEIAFFPALLVVIVLFAITIIGILAIPFAILGAVVLAFGGATLGFVAVAEMTGRTLVRKQTQDMLTPRGAQLRALVTGLAAYALLWILAACVPSDSAIGIALQGIASTVTTIAVTAGLGAVVLWRIEARRLARGVTPALRGGGAVDDASWQTPTPVSGVAAARRPTPAQPPGGNP